MFVAPPSDERLFCWSLPFLSFLSFVVIHFIRYFRLNRYLRANRENLPFWINPQPPPFR
jgi:hypothetical protein